MTDSGSSGSFPALAPLPGRNGSPIPINGPTVRIGQGPQNDVVLDDDTVSTSHARLEYVEGSWRLSDLGSRNGTFVNGDRVPAGGTVDLPGETPVAFGAVKLLFAPGSGTPPPAAEPTSATAPSVPLATRPGFRLPVWLLLLIILVIATIITLVIVIGGAMEPTALDVSDVALLLGFQTRNQCL